MFKLWRIASYIYFVKPALRLYLILFIINNTKLIILIIIITIIKCIQMKLK